MIKTIDTNEIPDEMLYAGVYAAERCADAGVTDLKDVIYDAIFSALKAAPAAEPAPSGWLRAIDEALVMHDVGVANADDDYATAKDKLNKLLCVVQDIGAYFAKQESAQSAAEPVSKRWDSLSSIGNRLHNISVEQHYAGNEKLSDELGEFASLLWIWDRTRKPTVPPAIVEPAQEVKPLVFNREHGCLWCKTSIGEYSIRDYFAAKAMQSLIVTLSNSDQADEQMIRLGLCEGEFDKLVAKCAYDYADAMIRSRGNL